MRRRWWIAGGIALVAALWFVVPIGLRRVDFFSLRRIELVGVRYLPADVILTAFAAGESASIFDRWGEHRERVQQLPGISTVTVRRRLPGTVRLIIDETEPVALSPGDGQMNLIDASGVVLPFDPSQSAPDLPVLVTPDSSTAELLGRIRIIDPALFARVSTVKRIEDDVLLTLDRLRIRLRADAKGAAIRAIVAVERDLESQGSTVTELDGRFEDQVVVLGHQA
jgi:cell division septal protein FtsQ